MVADNYKKHAKQLAELAEYIEMQEYRIEHVQGIINSSNKNRFDFPNYFKKWENILDTKKKALIRLQLRYNNLSTSINN